MLVKVLHVCYRPSICFIVVVKISLQSLSNCTERSAASLITSNSETIWLIVKKEESSFQYSTESILESVGSVPITV